VLCNKIYHCGVIYMDIYLRKTLLPGYILTVILLFAITYPAKLSAKTVTAKGISDLVEGKKAKTHNIALTNAKRAAVEQVAGSFVQSRTSVTDFVIAQDKVYSTSSGKITSYTILSQGINDFGAYEIEIEADVDVQALLMNIKETLKVNGWSRKPRVTLQINSNNASLGKTLASLFTSKLNKNGFAVFDRSKKVQAGFVLEINANMSTSNSDYQGMTISSNSLSLVTNVTRTDDGQIIASASLQASKASSNQAKVIEQVSKQLAAKTWSSLKSKLLNFWQEQQYVARSIYLDVKNLPSYQRSQSFSRSLKQSIPGLQDVELMKYDHKTGQFLLKYKGWPEQLHEEIFAGSLASDYQLDLVSVNSNHVTLRIK
jgi:hypothetical protein